MPSKKRRDEPSAVVTARTIFADTRERRENSDIYRHSKLVIERYEAGLSIAKADVWLAQIMVGIDPDLSD